MHTCLEVRYKICMYINFIMCMQCKKGDSYNKGCICSNVFIFENFLYVIKLYLGINFQIENGGKICKPNKTGCMPIHAAAFSGAKTCMEILLKKGKYFLFESGQYDSKLIVIFCFTFQTTVNKS